MDDTKELKMGKPFPVTTKYKPKREDWMNDRSITLLLRTDQGRSFSSEGELPEDLIGEPVSLVVGPFDDSLSVTEAYLYLGGKRVQGKVLDASVPVLSGFSLLVGCTFSKAGTHTRAKG